MEVSIFVKGLIIGFSIAAPVGPIGVLCIQRTINGGYRSGLLTGVGAATADAVYGSVAAFGLTAISHFLIRYVTWFSIIGGIFLCFLGVKVFLSKPNNNPWTLNNAKYLHAYISSFFLTVTNPMTILFFVGIFSGFGIIAKFGRYATALTLVSSVFLGSVLWWLLLSSLAYSFRTKFSSVIVHWINKVSGLVIITFGLFTLIRTFI
jgi:threonine/homoserine/homoserine lactone efflux protein